MIEKLGSTVDLSCIYLGLFGQFKKKCPSITSQKPSFIINKKTTSASIDLSSFFKKTGIKPASVAFSIHFYLADKSRRIQSVIFKILTFLYVRKKFFFGLSYFLEF